MSLRISRAPGIAMVALAAAFAIALAASPSHAQKSGVNIAAMDTTCAPCKDFYRYANGHWLDTAQLPASYMSIGTGRDIHDRNQEILHAALEKEAANAANEKDPTLQKVGWLYAALMDSARADREGVAPVQPLLDEFKNIRTPAELRAAFAKSVRLGIGGGFAGFGIPFTVGPEADPGQSSMNIAELFQGGMGLPERDFYFRTDPRSQAIRDAYVKNTGELLRLMGETDDIDKRADAVMALETALAESSMTRVAMRDPHALYNKMSVKEVGVLCPSLDWVAYFKDAGLPELASPKAMVDVSQPAFIRHLDSLLKSTPMQTWSDLIRVHGLRRAAPWLGQKAYDVVFELQSVFTGTKVPQARWKRASATMDAAMGEAVGQAYVAAAFPPSSKAKMIEMVNNIREAMKERIQSRPWMSDATKKQAIAKLDAIMLKIGYPDKWRDYTKLKIDPKDPAALMLVNASRFEVQRELDKIGKPVDRTEWGMSAATVNAYYNPSFNEIVFPAGILQPPYFDPNNDPAFSYGSIGMVIGHEITHGFDDQGSQYDKVGNLKNWWTDEDRKRFLAKTRLVSEQYSGYTAVDSLKVNGDLTLGENIADLGGLTIAYHAWKLSLKGRPSPVIDGFTGEQRFFLGHAQGWRRKLRPELIRTVVLSDPHSPARWRVDGPLSDMPEFAEAFHCKAGDAMVRNEKERPAIW